MVKKYVEWKKLDVKEDVRRVFAKRCRGGERKGQQAVVTDGRADAHEGLGVWGVQLDSQSLLWAVAALDHFEHGNDTLTGEMVW